MVMRMVKEGMTMRNEGETVEEAVVDFLSGMEPLMDSPPPAILARSEGEHPENSRKKSTRGHISLHLHVGGGIFFYRRAENARVVWWNVLRDVTGFDGDFVRDSDKCLLSSTNEASSIPITPGVGIDSGKEKDLLSKESMKAKPVLSNLKSSGKRLLFGSQGV
jgi:hypothetical protein